MRVFLVPRKRRVVATGQVAAKALRCRSCRLDLRDHLLLGVAEGCEAVGRRNAKSIRFARFIVVRKGRVEIWLFARNKVARKEEKSLDLVGYDIWRSQNI